MIGNLNLMLSPQVMILGKERFQCQKNRQIAVKVLLLGSWADGMRQIMPMYRYMFNNICPNLFLPQCVNKLKLSPYSMSWEVGNLLSGRELGGVTS